MHWQVCSTAAWQHVYILDSAHAGICCLQVLKKLKIMIQEAMKEQSFSTSI